MARRKNVTPPECPECARLRKKVAKRDEIIDGLLDRLRALYAEVWALRNKYERSKETEESRELKTAIHVLRQGGLRGKALVAQLRKDPRKHFQSVTLATVNQTLYGRGRDFLRRG